MKAFSFFPLLLACLASVTVLLLSGCGRGDSGAIDVTPPKEAASTLEQAFHQAPASVQDEVRQVSEAMRRGEYDKAVMSLQAVQEQSNVTLEQGMAVHGAMVSMESQLIQAIQSGDPNAVRAYELLRALKRN